EQLLVAHRRLQKVLVLGDPPLEVEGLQAGVTVHWGPRCVYRAARGPGDRAMAVRPSLGGASYLQQMGLLKIDIPIYNSKIMTTGKRQIRIAERVLTRLKIRQLHLLIAIAQRSSILHAAHDLNISQPTATKLLRDLEKDFG